MGRPRRAVGVRVAVTVAQAQAAVGVAVAGDIVVIFSHAGVIGAAHVVFRAATSGFPWQL